MADKPQSTLFREILGLPVVEQIVERWIQVFFGGAHGFDR